MYVYIQSEPRLHSAGFYGPDGKFQPESDWQLADDAAARVSYLNGGGNSAEWRQGAFGIERVREGEEKR